MILKKTQKRKRYEICNADFFTQDFQSYINEMIKSRKKKNKLKKIQTQDRKKYYV